jgi:hypothetical protein
LFTEKSKFNLQLLAPWAVKLLPPPRASRAVFVSFAARRSDSSGVHCCILVIGAQLVVSLRVMYFWSSSGVQDVPSVHF